MLALPYLSFRMNPSFYVMALVVIGSWLPAAAQGQAVQARRDSVDRIWKKKADSLSALRQYRQAGDSLQLVGWVDSVKQRVNTFFSSREQRLRGMLDSVRTKRKKERRVQHKLDSLDAARQGLLHKIDSSSTALQRRITDRYDRWQQKMDSVTGRFKAPAMPDLPAVPNVPGLPDVNLPAVEKLNLPSQPELQLTTLEKLNLPEIPSLSLADISKLQVSDEMKKLGVDVSLPDTRRLRGELDARIGKVAPMPEIQKGVEQAEAVLKDPGLAAEQAATSLDAVKEATGELNKSQQALAGNEAVELAESMKDPEALQDRAVEELKQQAMDHFVGKQEVLQQAMNVMGKYKKKFPSLASLEALPKNPRLPRNGLKGKPFRERIRVGMHVAIRPAADTLSVDFFPSVSYHITGRVEAGGGMMYRVRAVKDRWRLDQKTPVWGFSGFTTFKINNAFRWRVEADATSNPGPPSLGDTGIERRWRWAWLTGIQTTFNISGRIMGQVHMLYNFERKLRDGFPDFLTMRVGVQYRFKAQ
jgi:hypothetical protein